MSCAILDLIFWDFWKKQHLQNLVRKCKSWRDHMWWFRFSVKTIEIDRNCCTNSKNTSAGLDVSHSYCWLTNIWLMTLIQNCCNCVIAECAACTSASKESSALMTMPICKISNCVTVGLPSFDNWIRNPVAACDVLCLYQPSKWRWINISWNFRNGWADSFGARCLE